MKKFLSGLLIGVILATTSTAFAAVGDKVEAIFSTFNFKVNGKEKTIDALPLVVNGKSYLPVTEIANMLGYDVTYKADSRTIEFNTTSVSEGGKSVSTETGIEKTTYDDVEAIIYNGETYYSPKGFVDKYYSGKEYRFRNPAIITYRNGIFTINMKNGEVITFDKSDTSSVIIHEGTTYINVKYYPDIENGLVPPEDWYEEQIQNATGEEKERLESEKEKFYPSQNP